MSIAVLNISENVKMKILITIKKKNIVLWKDEHSLLQPSRDVSKE